MANLVYLNAKDQIANGDIDFVNADIRLMLVDSSTTADTENTGIDFIDDFTTLGELSGTGYARAALANQAVNKDVGNNRAEFDADDVTFTGIDAGTAQAALIYLHVTNDADSIPILYIDTTDFPIVTNGGDVTLNFNAEGILQFT